LTLVCLSALAEGPPPVEGEGGNPGWFMASPSPEPAGERASTLAEAESGLSATAISTNGADAVTSEIVELARGLDNDPVRLYEFVHNHIRYEPYYGSLKGATRTLRDRAGNDCDQASLLLALLRQSGVEAKYAYGTLTLPTIAYDGTPNAWNWLGASDPLDALIKGGIPATAGSGGATVTLDYMCVDANVSNTWIRLAPSLKAYNVSAAQDLSTMMGYHRSQVLAAAGGTATADYAQNLTEQALRLKLDGLSSNLLVSMQGTMPNASVEEVMGARKIWEESYASLPTNFPSSCVFALGQNYTTVPTNLEHRVKIQYGGITNTLALHNIAHRKLTMKYDQLIVGANSVGSVGVQEAPESLGVSALVAPVPDQANTNVETLGTSSYTYPTITQGGYSDALLTFTNPNYGYMQVYYNWINNAGAFQFFDTPFAGGIPQSQTRTYTVRFSGAGMTRGVKTARLSITTYRTEGIYGGLMLSNPVTDYYDLSGTVAETPNMTAIALPSFGWRYFQETVETNFVVRNEGSVNLVITGGTITGADGSRFTVVSGNTATTIPPSSTHTIRIRYRADLEGVHTNAFYQIPFTFDGFSYTRNFQLLGQTVSRPRASLLLDDAILAAENSSVSGTVATCALTITHPYSNCNQTVVFPFKRGSLYAIMCGFGDAESGLTLARNQRQLEALRAKSSDSSSEVLTQCLHVMGQTWLDESALVNQAIERISGVSPIFHHRFGVMAQEAGYFVDVKAQVMSYYSNEFGGMAVDAGMKAGSLVASSLEHAILEQLQGADRSGVSTVKLLQMANANGEKIYRMTASNAVSVLAALTNYPAEVKNQFLASATNGLVQVLPRNGAITAGQWVGNGYVLFGFLPGGQYQVGMIISGDYHGGYSFYSGALESLIAVNAQHNIVARAAEARYPVSADPVDLATGSFLYSADDLALGGADPVGLRFSHYYSSLDATRLRTLGYGWTHNYDVFIEEHSSWQGGMGLRTPAEAVPLMVAAFVAGDLAASEDNPKGWATAALVSKWATDQLTTNAVTVYLGNRALTFVRLPDGRYTPPPGVTMSLSKTNGLYTLSERNGREYRFNATRRLASIVDPDNNTMSLAYNAATNLSTVTDACGRSLTFNYSAALLTNVVDSTGRSVTMQGDAASNLSTFTDSAGSVWRFVYDTNHCLTGTVEPGGVTNALNTYDSLSRVKQQANGRGLVSQLLYADYRTVEQDPAGNRKTYYFDDKQREIGRELVPGAAAWSAYDGQNHTVATMDPLSRINYAIYDGNHNILQTIDPLNQVSYFNYDSLNRLVEAVTPLGLVTRTEYDAKHHPIRITGSASNRVECVYSATGLLEKKIEIPAAAIGGGAPRTNSWLYSTWRTPSEMFHPDGSREAFNYNARGDLLTHTDTRSNTTVFTYDNRGLRLSQTDALGGIASNNWNALGLLVSSTDQRGKTTAFTYTKTREPASVTAPDGGVVSNVYDNAGRVIAVINPRGGVTSNTWDTAGRLIAKRDPNGVTMRLAYDSVGNVLATTDGLGNVSTNIYDTLNRLVEARSPNGAVATTEYDADSRVTAVVDSLGRRTEFTLDALSRKVAIKRPDNRFERYAFDGHGNLLAFTNAAGNVQCFTYDSMGRKTGESNAVGTVRSYEFDAAGNLTAKTDGNGRVTTFSYNAANRLTGLHYADNSVVTFTNDAAGNLTGMGDPWGTGASAASHDNVGRLSAWTDHHNSTIQYKNDKAGAVTNIIYPGNLTVTYGWDTAGRLVSVQDWASHSWTFSYDGANRLSGIQYPNGVNYSREYNADGQLTNYVHSKSGTPFISRTFERNSAGLKTREVISAGLEVEQPDTWQKHTSDKADRLTGLSRRDEYVLPENWRGYTPSYNQEGQVTNVCEGYRSWSSDNNLIWDAAGRLVEYTGLRQTNMWTDLPPLPSWGLNLAYDGLSARTVRTDELVTHRLVVDRVGRLNLPLVETDSGNTPIRYFIWAPGIGLLAQIEANATIHYFHADENGSTLAMTDSIGNVSDQFAYSPWGELLGRTGTNMTAFTFVGGGGVTWEGGSLYRMGARYYDARLKRWLSADPIGMAGGANLYLYCNGNPLMWVDLLGLCGESISGLMWNDFKQQNVALGNSLKGWAGASLGPLVQSVGDMMALPDRALDGLTGTTPESRMAWAANTPVPFDDLAAGTLGALGAIGGTLRMEGSLLRDGVRAYEVGTYNTLKARSVVGDTLDIHHVGQASPMGQLLPGYNRATAPAIALPELEHGLIPTVRSETTMTPRGLLANDIWNLRNFTEAPNSSLQNLIQLNKEMYPGGFKK
jgi:RHS repeat-associated protein